MSGVLPLLLSMFLHAIAATDLEWTRAASLPPITGHRHHPIAFANETHGFVLTGSTYRNAYSNNFYMYEEATDQWTDLTTSSTSAFPGIGRSFAYGVVLPVILHSKAYLGLGAAAEGQRLTDWWEFDMKTHAWKRLADLPGPGRRHPAMNAVQNNQGKWEIHVGLGDESPGNLNDFWKYSIDDDEWQRLPDFPSSPRHHPFFFSLGGSSYAGLGHSDVTPYIERDWYRFETSDGNWYREADFASFNPTDQSLVTTEARVAGTEFSMQVPGSNKVLGFVLSGDGDDHQSMGTGEFHVFDPETKQWNPLPPHPGYSRWAPGSFVMRGTTRAYFTSGYDRVNQVLLNDLWRIDLAPLFPVPVVVSEDEKTGVDDGTADIKEGSSTTPSPLSSSTPLPSPPPSSSSAPPPSSSCYTPSLTNALASSVLAVIAVLIV